CRAVHCRGHERRRHQDRRLSLTPSAAKFSAAATQLQTLGGIHLRTEEDEHDYFAVMTDPEGNEFCID
ncbi:MAG TPA: VOC family protein, partial [Streptosporangiaceae bacterium]|nr:VOC family protein [Streptosporangiaceae bacterium]